MLCFLRFFMFHPVPLSDGCRILFSMATERYYSNVLSLPHSSTFLCLVCHPAIVLVLFVVRRSFVLSFSLHIRPCSLLPLLPLFACCCCFFCASLRSAFRASRCYLCAPFAFFQLLFGVLLFFLCLALFVLLSVLRAVICARPLPFFLLLSALLFNKHRKPAICSTVPRTARHNQDLHRRNQGRRSGGQGLGQPAIPPLLLQAAVTRHHRQHPRHKKKPKEIGTTHEQESAKPSAILPHTFKDF